MYNNGEGYSAFCLHGLQIIIVYTLSYFLLYLLLLCIKYNIL